MIRSLNIRDAAPRARASTAEGCCPEGTIVDPVNVVPEPKGRQQPGRPVDGSSATSMSPRRGPSVGRIVRRLAPAILEHAEAHGLSGWTLSHTTRSGERAEVEAAAPRVLARLARLDCIARAKRRGKCGGRTSDAPQSRVIQGSENGRVIRILHLA